MEKRLLVLYRNGKMEQTWCIYSGGEEEAEREGKIMDKHDDSIEEIGRIWITTTAKLDCWND